MTTSHFPLILSRSRRDRPLDEPLIQVMEKRGDLKRAFMWCLHDNCTFSKSEASARAPGLARELLEEGSVEVSHRTDPERIYLFEDVSK